MNSSGLEEVNHNLLIVLCRYGEHSRFVRAIGNMRCPEVAHTITERDSFVKVLDEAPAVYTGS